MGLENTGGEGKSLSRTRGISGDKLDMWEYPLGCTLHSGYEWLLAASSYGVITSTFKVGSRCVLIYVVQAPGRKNNFILCQDYGELIIDGCSWALS